MESLITIAIPFYNDHDYLRSAILSVVNQTYTNWKLILLDDGSNDGSLAIANSFVKDCRIIVLSDGKNMGLPSRLNQLSTIVDTKYYARMDADDIMDPDRIKTELEYLEAHSDVDVIGSYAYSIDESGNVFGKINTNNRHPKTIDDILKGGGFVHPTVMGKTEWFKAHPYNEKLRRMQDLALWFETVDTSHFVILPVYLLFYRTGKTSIKKYLRTQKYSRSFYYNVFLKERKDLRRFCLLYSKSLLKTLIYYIAFCTLGIDKIINNRYVPINEDEKNMLMSRLRISLTEYKL